jgi:hypothetical protein
MAPQSKVEIEVAVLQTKVDHIEESIHGIRDQLQELESRVIRLEKTTYMLLGGLILLQALPMVQEFLGTL